MKKLILITVCMYATMAYGQVAHLKANYFIDCKRLETIDSFNIFIMAILPDYHLTKVDSSTKKAWEFSFKNNDNDTLTFVYTLQCIGGNPQLKKPPIYGIGDVSIDGQFLTLAKIYNNIFNTKYTPEEMMAKKMMNTDVLPHGNCRYYFIFGADYGWNILIKNCGK